jgi:hypothetical protein
VVLDKQFHQILADYQMVARVHKVAVAVVAAAAEQLAALVGLDCLEKVAEVVVAEVAPFLLVVQAVAVAETLRLQIVVLVVVLEVTLVVQALVMLVVQAMHELRIGVNNGKTLCIS